MTQILGNYKCIDLCRNGAILDAGGRPDPSNLQKCLNTAGSSMTSSGRPSPENHFSERRGVPSRTEGERVSGNALETSNALSCRALGFPAVLSRGILAEALSAFLESICPEFLPESPSRVGGMA